MPKKARTSQEIHKYKNTILKEALKIINEKGYHALSMRTLARNLGITATTIYDYIENKESLHLNILALGFEMLGSHLIRGIENVSCPEDRLNGLTEAFIDFGTAQSEYYDLMFGTDIPHFSDYRGTPLEIDAKHLYLASMRSRDLSRKVIQQNLQSSSGQDSDNTDFYYIKWLTGIHGIVSLYNSSIFQYLSDDGKIKIEDLAMMHTRTLFSAIPP